MEDVTQVKTAHEILDGMHEKASLLRKVADKLRQQSASESKLNEELNKYLPMIQRILDTYQNISNAFESKKQQTSSTSGYATTSEDIEGMKSFSSARPRWYIHVLLVAIPKLS